MKRGRAAASHQGPLYALRGATYPTDWTGKKDHHKAALAAVCYAAAVWRGETGGGTP